MELQPPVEAQRRDERSAAEPQSHDFGPPIPRRGVPVVSACRPVPVPEGRRRRLAGGKSAPADAAPGNGTECLRAPAGHRRNGPECRTITGGDPDCPRRRVVAEIRRGGRRQELLRCPAGAWPVWRGNRGLRPLARACPRLISCGVPPGPKPTRRQQSSDAPIVVSAAAKSPRAARISRGARLCARSTSRSGLAARNASKSNGCVRGFGAAAAGPRRTQPRSVGAA